MARWQLMVIDRGVGYFEHRGTGGNGIYYLTNKAKQPYLIGNGRAAGNYPSFLKTMVTPQQLPCFSKAMCEFGISLCCISVNTSFML